MNNFEFVEAVLRLSFEVGIAADGKPMISTKSYRNVKAQQSAAALMAVANAIASLTNYQLATVTKSEVNEIVTV